jgi:hypothetical protein
LPSFDIDRSTADPEIHTFVVGGAESQGSLKIRRHPAQ